MTIFLTAIISDLIFPVYQIGVIIMVTIILLNIILFGYNWKRNNDIKSIGFILALICLSLGSLIGKYFNIEGYFFLSGGVVWALIFSGLLERIYEINKL